MALRLRPAAIPILVLQCQLTTNEISSAPNAVRDGAFLSGQPSVEIASGALNHGTPQSDPRERIAPVLQDTVPCHPDVLADAANALGVSLAVIQAVAHVESNGNGFLDSGRPVVRFERHVFYRRLAAHGVNPAELTKQQSSIVFKKAGGYLGGELEHLRLKQAMDLHTLAAYESASWGAFQIMGYHWKAMGYASVHDFVGEMHGGYAQHVAAFVRFVSADARLHAALLAKDWKNFARRYNGPNYMKNAYDLKLSEAYARLGDCVCKAE